MRWRITVRGVGIELRGFIDADHLYEVERLFALVVAVLTLGLLLLGLMPARSIR